MYCQKCGEQIEEGQKFCTKCGYALLSSTVERRSSKKIVLRVIGIVILVVLLGWFFIPADETSEEGTGTTILNEMNSSIEPVGEFKKTILSKLLSPDGEITEEDWLTGVNYFEDQLSVSPKQLTQEEQIFSSVVKIICEDGEYFYYGSGTSIDPAGYILTNQHVVEDSSDGYCLVGFPDPFTGLIKDAYWGQTIIDDEATTGHDLAYIALTSPAVDDEGNVFGYYDRIQKSTFPYLDYYSDECIDTPPSLGENIRVLGYPPLSGGALTITNGLISSLYSQDGYLITSAKIVSGNSGGLAVNERGCHIGVPTAVYYDDTTDDERLGEIIDLEFVFEFDDAIQDELDEYYVASGIKEASIIED